MIFKNLGRGGEEGGQFPIKLGLMSGNICRLRKGRRKIASSLALGVLDLTTEEALFKKNMPHARKKKKKTGRWMAEEGDDMPYLKALIFFF